MSCYSCAVSVNASIRLALKYLLTGVAWVLFATAGLSFWFGGRAIHEFAKTERLLAEMEGIGLAAVCGALGAFAKAAAENLAEADIEFSNSDQINTERRT